jgi:hypothetical protein
VVIPAKRTGDPLQWSIQQVQQSRRDCSPGLAAYSRPDKIFGKDSNQHLVNSTLVELRKQQVCKLTMKVLNEIPTNKALLDQL